MKVTKPLLCACVALLAACSDPNDIKLSEVTPKVMTAMSDEDQEALTAYIMDHADLNDPNFMDKVTVKEAIKIGKAELAKKKSGKAGR